MDEANTEILFQPRHSFLNCFLNEHNHRFAVSHNRGLLVIRNFASTLVSQKLSAFFLLHKYFLLLSFLFLCIFAQLDGCNQCFGQTAYPCHVFVGAASQGGHVSGLTVSVSISFNPMNICNWTSSIAQNAVLISIPHVLPIYNSIQQNLKFNL